MFSLSYLLNTPFRLTSWAFNYFSPSAAKAAAKVEKVVQPEIRMGLLSRSWYWLNHWRPDIQRDYTEITNEWSAIGRMENGLQKLNTSDLESKIALFLQRYSSCKNDDQYTKIEALGTQITQKPTEIAERITTSQIIIRDDGHCLFDAFAVAYLELPHTSQEICTYETFPREHLRKIVVEYEKDNYHSDVTLQISLNEALKEYKESTIKDFTEEIQACDYDQQFAKRAESLKQQKDAFEALSDDQLRERYFDHMERMDQKPLWGGQAELYALSKLYDLTIHIEQEGYTISFNEERPTSVTLVRINNNHFNARRRNP